MMNEGMMNNADVCSELRKARASGDGEVMRRAMQDLVSYGESTNATRESLAAIVDAPLNADARATVSDFLDRFTFEKHVKASRAARLEEINDLPEGDA